MATRLEASRNKLERLRREFGDTADTVMHEASLMQGEPSHNNSRGRSNRARFERMDDKFYNAGKALKEQERRVERMEQWEENKERGMTKSGGYSHSPQALPALRKELADFEDRKAKTEESGESSWWEQGRIRRIKKAIEDAEKLVAKSEKRESAMSEHAKQIIESGKVTQWAKRPTVYFVKGLRKVAVELGTDGEMHESIRYKAFTDTDKAKVSKILEGGE